MKKALILLVLMLISSGLIVHAQDIIVKAENDTVKCKILNVSEETIQYQTQNNGIWEKNTLPRKYIQSYSISENNESMVEYSPLKKEKQTSFRFAIAGGYARRLGELFKTEDPATDQISKDLRNGYALDAEIQYYFNEVYGIALNVKLALDVFNRFRSAIFY